MFALFGVIIIYDLLTFEKTKDEIYLHIITYLITAWGIFWLIAFTQLFAIPEHIISLLFNSIPIFILFVTGFFILYALPYRYNKLPLGIRKKLRWIFVEQMSKSITIKWVRITYNVALLLAVLWLIISIVLAGI